MMVEFLKSPPIGPRRGAALLAHGSGGPMHTPFLNRFAGHAAEAGLEVVRFEFAYMAGRRTGGPKRPPPAVEALVGEYLAALDELLASVEGPVLIGGKSMGSRVAAMAGGSPDLDPRVRAVFCLGYPFHPPIAPEKLRLEPLLGLRVPALVVQGERDTYGTPAEVASYDLPETIRILWAEDGNHDLAPRGASPATWDGNLAAAAKAVAALLP